MTIDALGQVMDMELTPCEFNLLARIADSASVDDVHYPEWDRIRDVTGYTTQQINRMLGGLWQDGLISVVGVSLLPIVTDSPRRAGIRIGERRLRPEPVPKDDEPRPGWVYLMHGVGTQWYKIGISDSPKVRRAQLGTQGPFKYDLLNTFEIDDARGAEVKLHALFAKVRAEGEWFILRDDDVYWFCQLDCATLDDLMSAIEQHYGLEW